MRGHAATSVYERHLSLYMYQNLPRKLLEQLVSTTMSELFR